MNDPYVPTTTGWRRKIGPKSKYGFNESNATRTSQRVGSTPSRLGSAMPQRESGFAVSMRESREVSEANAAMEAKEKARTAKAKAAEIERKQTQGTNRQAPPFAAAAGRRPSFTGGIGDMLKKARESGKRQGRTPYRSSMR